MGENDIVQRQDFHFKNKLNSFYIRTVRAYSLRIIHTTQRDYLLSMTNSHAEQFFSVCIPPSLTLKANLSWLIRKSAGDRPKGLRYARGLTSTLRFMHT
jgi:hypothetical protein